MKKNGTLRPEDEKKYGLYGKLGYSNDTSINGHKSYHSYQNITLQKQSKFQPIGNQSSDYLLKVSKRFS